MDETTVLVVDDDSIIRRTLKYQLAKRGHRAIAARSGEECLYHVTHDDVDLVLLDIRLPDMDGIDVLKQIRQVNVELPIIMVTAYWSIESAVEAMKAGAYDYITKPINFEVLMMKAEKALQSANDRREIARLRAAQEGQHSFSRIIGHSSAIQQVISMAQKMAQNDATTILICGDSGTGKDLFARAIHYSSARADKPFMEITCTALPVELLESELFGHERGAFTDAKTRKEGLLELAAGGTVFLNEIGHMEVALQAKLLSFLENKTFRRIGGKKEIHVDVRIIAATNRDLKAAVAEGDFREDLYYRLNVLSLFIPPLRTRKEDIMLLAHYFLAQFRRESGKNIEGFSEAAQECLVNFDWPGNVRELKNVVERAVILAEGTLITPDLLAIEVQRQEATDGISKLRQEGFSLEEFEKDLIRQALDVTGWNQSKAAELLKLGRGALQYRMKKYGFLR